LAKEIGPAVENMSSRRQRMVCSLLTSVASKSWRSRASKSPSNLIPSRLSAAPPNIRLEGDGTVKAVSDFDGPMIKIGD
jgi:hypothetical protein